MRAVPRVTSLSIEGSDISAPGWLIRGRVSFGGVGHAPLEAAFGHVIHGHAGALAFFAGRV
jgi:hypothetical protein